MTLKEIQDYDRDFLTPEQAAPVLGCDAQGLRIWAKKRPHDLGFPVCVVGSRVKIPRRPFIKFITGEEV